jgi:two-component system nitrate/nitrite response regulator NarL
MKRTAVTRSAESDLGAGRNGGPRVLVVDDHRLFADVIVPVLSAEGLEVVAVVTTASEALERVDDLDLDLVVLDLGLPDMGGVALGRKILERYPDMKLLAVTAMSDPKVLQEAIKSGFHGYLTKDTSLGQFISSVRAVLDGQVVMPRVMARAATGARTPEEESAEVLARQLTSRELDVLALLVEGLGGDAIADQLTVSPNTVRTHVQNILTKLQVHSRLEAAAFAVRHGLVQNNNHRSA